MSTLSAIPNASGRGGANENAEFEKSRLAHLAVFELLKSLHTEFERIATAAAVTLQSGGTLFFCGNGGSASDAQHLAAELVGRFVDSRRPLRALALNSDTSALTCISNDFGYDHIFARQLEGLGRAGDMVVLISTSGKSKNLLIAADAANRIGATSAALLGKGGGDLAGAVDMPLVVPSDTTARIQEAHIFIGHVLCARIEQQLGLA